MDKKNNNYDFDLIVSSEALKRNREKNLNLTKKVVKRRKLKRWVKNILWMILGAFIGIIIYQLFTVETVHETPVGSYTCRGGIFQVCSGSNEVADYLGVE